MSELSYLFEKLDDDDNTAEAMVIIKELLQIHLDNRCWRTGCPICCITGHFAGLLVAQVQVSAAAKARRCFHFRVSTIMFGYSGISSVHSRNLTRNLVELQRKLFLKLASSKELLQK